MVLESKSNLTYSENVYTYIFNIFSHINMTTNEQQTYIEKNPSERSTIYSKNTAPIHEKIFDIREIKGS